MQDSSDFTKQETSMQQYPYLPPKSLAQLYDLYKSGALDSGPVKTSFYGWIKRVRIGGGGTLTFIDVYDGTCVGVLMCITSEEFYLGNKFIPEPDSEQYELTDSKSFTTLQLDQLGKFELLSEGCSVVIDGLLEKAPEKATQKFEFKIQRLRVIGRVYDPAHYPIQKTSEKQLATLRQYPFMRVRAQAMQCLFRIASDAEYGIHKFMRKQGVVKVDPNILTMSDCEGAGETFMISPQIFSTDRDGKEIPVGLTVSSQLPLESAICGFKQVYTSQKSFRAEKSDTMKHLAEFLHIEYEGAFITLPQLMDFTEKLIKYVIRYVHEKCKDDLDFLESKFAPTDVKSSRDLLTLLLDRPFAKIKHCDAIDLIHKIVKEKMLLPDDNGKMVRVKLERLPLHGEDVGSEHEKLLVRYFGWTMLTDEERQKRLQEKKEFGAFVFLTHWPLKIKSFYMKKCDDSDECLSFDLLCPRIGELVGSSIREDSYEKLMSEVIKRNMDIKPIQWYIDLRKSGTACSGGFGLGFARLATLLSGASSVRDVTFLPVYYNHCPY
jgi:asparaginyl-tRNA synthetase